MASYELVFKKSVAKDLRAFPAADVERILERVRALALDPRPPGCEELSGRERYRVRQGAYRIVYEIGFPPRSAGGEDGSPARRLPRLIVEKCKVHAS
jgi:mRNA interferase RelE/StbE